MSTVLELIQIITRLRFGHSGGRLFGVKCLLPHQRHCKWAARRVVLYTVLLGGVSQSSSWLIVVGNADKTPAVMYGGDQILSLVTLQINSRQECSAIIIEATKDPQILASLIDSGTCVVSGDRLPGPPVLQKRLAPSRQDTVRGGLNYLLLEQQVYFY